LRKRPTNKLLKRPAKAPSEDGLKKRRPKILLAKTSQKKTKGLKKANKKGR
jgi:hypothetical protein